jgi:hypothetical protein
MGCGASAYDPEKNPVKKHIYNPLNKTVGAYKSALNSRINFDHAQDELINELKIYLSLVENS